MWIKWFPWKFVLKRTARSEGFLDPVMLLSRMSQFAQPAEVLAPLELLRAGAVMHARGLINSQVIQHNLDWVWPLWAQLQFDPQDPSFIPRAFSITQINLTHRNWTAVGVPGFAQSPVVDPRGLVMPFYDSWSIDFWIAGSDGKLLIPSRISQAQQKVHCCQGEYKIETLLEQDGMKLCTCVEMVLKNGIPVCRIDARGYSAQGGALVVALRPYNPEGIAFIHQVKSMSSLKGWVVDKDKRIFLDHKPDLHRFSVYRDGDVFHWLNASAPEQRRGVVCDVGMATAMVSYRMDKKRVKRAGVDIPLVHSSELKGNIFPLRVEKESRWQQSLKDCAKIAFNINRYGELYELAVRTLLIHTPGTCYAGPYTYKRFWFRDTAFIINALLCSGMIKRTRSIIEGFFEHQTASGYFLSQDGEWDSNGQALWAMERYCALSAHSVSQSWKDPIIKGCNWIMQKRRKHPPSSPFAGLMPPGFSAEHLGLNDHYYWDNFWSIAGLRAGATLLRSLGESDLANGLEVEREDYLRAVETSLKNSAGALRGQAMAASPNRRLDSGAVGSLAAGYPLEIWGPRDQRLLLTARYLFENCLVDNAFYHDISHSGINPYLSLHIAQVLMRGGDTDFSKIMEAVASLASPTGQWPEAIHPQTKAGCMGDGQHTWAAAEWVVMVRNCFVREQGEALLIGGGILPSSLHKGAQISFGPAPTLFGPCQVSVVKEDRGRIRVSWSGQWNQDKEPPVRVVMPAMAEKWAKRGEVSVVLGE